MNLQPAISTIDLQSSAAEEPRSAGCSLPPSSHDDVMTGERRPRKRRRRLVTGVLTRLSGRIALQQQREEVALAEVEEEDDALLLVLRAGLTALLPSLRTGRTYEFHEFSKRVVLSDDHGYRREAQCSTTEDSSCIKEIPSLQQVLPRLLPANDLVAHLESPPSVLQRDQLLATPFTVTGNLEYICRSGWIALTHVTAQAVSSSSIVQLDKCKVFFPHYYPTNLSASFKVVSVHSVLPMYLWERRLEGFYSTISSAICQQGSSDAKSTEEVVLRVPKSVSQRCAMFCCWYFRSASFLATCFHQTHTRNKGSDVDSQVTGILSVLDSGKSPLFEKHSYLAEFSDIHFTELFEGAV